MIIRKFQEKDKKSIIECIYQLQLAEKEFDQDIRIDERVGNEYYEELQNNINNNSGTILVSEINQKVCGFVCGFTEKDTISQSPYLYISDLVVMSDFRGQGIGKQLLLEIEIYAISIKVRRIMLNVINENSKAKDLYLKTNFKVRTLGLYKDI